MLAENTLKQALEQGRSVFGLFCSTPAPLVVEMIAAAGFDFVILDAEHTLTSPERLEHMIRAADAAGLVSLVRVPEAPSRMIVQVLDAGAGGVVLPRVRTAEQAADAVALCRYHPDGCRGLNAGRPAGFGRMDLTEYIRYANDQVLVAAMIEDQEGASNAQAIAAVHGIDLLIEGAADLSQSLGMPWRTGAQEVRATLNQIRQAAQTQGVSYCALPRTEEDFAAWRAQGVSAFVLGDDRGLAYRAYRDRLAEARRSLDAEIPPTHARSLPGD